METWHSFLLMDTKKNVLLVDSRAASEILRRCDSSRIRQHETLKGLDATVHAFVKGEWNDDQSDREPGTPGDGLPRS